MAAPVVNSTTTNSVLGTTAGALSTSVTVGAGLSNSLLIVFFTGTNNQATGATWNAVAMTAGTAEVGNYYFHFFWIANPASGTLTGTVNFGAAINDVAVSWVLLTGAAQTTPVDVEAFADGAAGTTASVTATTATANTLVLDQCTSQITTHTQAVGQTELWNFQIGGTGPRVSGSDKVNATASAVTMSVTMGASVFFGIQLVAIKPAAAAVVSNSRNLTLLGVGI